LRRTAGEASPRPGDSIGSITTDLESTPAQSIVQRLINIRSVTSTLKARRRKLSNNDECSVVGTVSALNQNKTDMASHPKEPVCAQTELRQFEEKTAAVDKSGDVIVCNNEEKSGGKRSNLTVDENAPEGLAPSDQTCRKKKRTFEPAMSEVSEPKQSEEIVTSGQAIPTLISCAGGNIATDDVIKFPADGSSNRLSLSQASASVPDTRVPDSSLLNRGPRRYSGETLPPPPFPFSGPPPFYGPPPLTSFPPPVMNFPPPAITSLPPPMHIPPPVINIMPPNLEMLPWPSPVPQETVPIQHNPAPALIEIPISKEISKQPLVESVKAPENQEARSVGHSAGSETAHQSAPVAPKFCLPPPCPCVAPTADRSNPPPPPLLPSGQLPSPARARLPQIALPRPVAAGGCRTCVLDSAEQLASMEPRPCPSCPLLEVLCASQTELRLMPGQIVAVAATLAEGMLKLERVRIFCGEGPRAVSGCLTLPAADHVEVGASPVVCPVQGGLVLVSVVNSQREVLVVKKGLKLGFGQPFHIKKSI
jgi:hypothetical protein